MQSKTPSSLRPAAAVAAGALLLSACLIVPASGDPAAAPTRAAVDAPERFVSQHPVTAAVPPDTIPGPACHSPLYDPVDGTELRMRRAFGGTVGDYAVPAGRYGVGPRELLRLECNTGRVIGIVRA